MPDLVRLANFEVGGTPPSSHRLHQIWPSTSCVWAHMGQPACVCSRKIACSQGSCITSCCYSRALLVAADQLCNSTTPWNFASLDCLSARIFLHLRYIGDIYKKDSFWPPIKHLRKKIVSFSQQSQQTQKSSAPHPHLSGIYFWRKQ